MRESETFLIGVAVGFAVAMAIVFVSFTMTTYQAGRPRQSDIQVLKGEVYEIVDSFNLSVSTEHFTLENNTVKAFLTVRYPDSNDIPYYVLRNLRDELEKDGWVGYINYASGEVVTHILISAQIEKGLK